jgi:predicted amidohydrolase
VSGAPAKLRVAACAYPIEPVTSFEQYADKQTRLVAEASARGAKLLVFPEYASMELASLVPEAERRTLAAELHSVQPWLGPMLELFTRLATSHDVHILSPSFPEHLSAVRTTRNRARLHAPSGASATIEKQQMTRFESEEWGILPGERGTVIDSALGTLGVAICYDSEFPLLVRRQVEAGADLVLIPSCTDTFAGYHRVSLSARARALENQCFTVVAPTVGSAPWSHCVDENHGAAAVNGPVDRGFADDGVLVQGALDQPGWVYAELDFAALARVREGGQVRNHRDWELPAHLSGGLERISCK